MILSIANAEAELVCRSALLVLSEIVFLIMNLLLFVVYCHFLFQKTLHLL